MGRNGFHSSLFASDKHASYVQRIFSRIASRYDLMNRVLSLGIDVFWRRFSVSHMRFSRTLRVLDVASGTADVAIIAAKRFPEIYVFSVDTVGEMIEVGFEKVRREKLDYRIFFIKGDALNLPFANDSFDVAIIAFGIRNILNRKRVLEEMARVVVPGGQVLVLEMHVPSHSIFRLFFRLYSKSVVPVMANLFSPQPDAYEYLIESIGKFHTPEELSSMMKEGGLGDIVHYSLTFGFAHLYVGRKF
ncbi:MAG: bifunctional demethylmenaquinone methyltransferase/2-methoxy-6-polyprenyl-1,4-benzoquinol methylase UbiE [Syntrophales bacterium]|nr:bifunctional demethylmenaquinone methyltransferase/2-methoxy-6-polyprenyl-1,4-benzoquinol methylase UbiE [Syntrophales bacterium]